MKHLLISDIHATDDKDRAEDLQDRFIILQSKYEDIDKIFLLGDIFDIWRDSMESIAKVWWRFIASCMWGVNANKGVYYIVGNHDDAVVPFYSILPNKYLKLQNFYICSRFNPMQETGIRAISLHGHQLDPVMLKHYSLSKAGTWLQEAWHRLSGGEYGDLGDCISPNDWSFKSALGDNITLLEKMREEAAGKYGNDFRFVFHGHTHAPDIYDAGTCVIVDTGSFGDNGDFVLVDEGERLIELCLITQGFRIEHVKAWEY